MKFAMTLLVVSLAFVGVARAAENPTGKWTWEQMRGDRKVEVTLNLKLDGDKLTGSMPGRNNTETPIADARYRDGTVTPGTRYSYSVLAVDSQLPLPNVSGESATVEETAR